MNTAKIPCCSEQPAGWLLQQPPWSLINRCTILKSALLTALATCTIAAGADPAPPVSPTMESSYNVLLTRSIFSKDHNRPAAASHPAPTTHPSDEPVAGLIEGNLVLRGVGVADDQPTAIFEQMSDHQIVKIHLGDPLLRGIISGGTLDGVDYVVDGKASHITIGQALDGGSPVVPSSSTSSGNNATPSEHPSGEKPKWWRGAK